MARFFTTLFIGFLIFTLQAQPTNRYNSFGQKHGKWEYWEVDTVRYKYYFSSNSRLLDSLNSLKDSDNFHIIHRLLFEGYYENGRKSGQWIFYKTTTTYTAKTLKYTDDNGFQNRFVEKIAFCSVHFKDDNLHGVLTSFYDNKTVLSSINFNSGYPSDSVIVYYDNSKLRYKGVVSERPEFYYVSEYYKTGSKRIDKLLNIRYVIDRFSHLKEVMYTLQLNGD